MANFNSPVEPPFRPASIGDRVQHARRLLGVFIGWDITQAHLAEFLEVPASTVAGLEGDGVQVGPFVEALCSALGMRREYLLFGREPMAGMISQNAKARWRTLLQAGDVPGVIAARQGFRKLS